MRNAALAARLDEGLDALGLALAPESRAALLRLVAALERWNRAMDLVAPADAGTLLARHVLDSLAVLPWVAGTHVADLGCGAGFPGLPLAIARPDLRFTLIDSRAKRLAFARQMVIDLALAHVEVVEARLESYHPRQRFETLTARAFAPLPTILHLAEPLLADGGRLLALKGREQAELASLTPPWRLIENAALAVPGIAGARCVWVLGRDAEGAA